jgi:hypothetical protein
LTVNRAPEGDVMIFSAITAPYRLRRGA